MKTKKRGVFEKVPGSGTWWIRFTDSQGRYRREKAGTWTQADNLLTKRKHEALQGVKLPETLRRRGVLFSEIADDAVAWSLAHKRHPANDKSMIGYLKQWFGERAAESLETHEISAQLDAMKRENKWSPARFNRYRTTLLLIYRQARLAKKVTTNPAKDVPHQEENNKRVRFLSRDQGENGEKSEYERLRKAITDIYPEHLGEFLFAINTGLRLSSQYTMTYEMVDFQRGTLDLPRTKNGEPLHLPLNGAALDAIRSASSLPLRERTGLVWRNHRNPMSNDRWFKPAMKAAGVTNFKWHDIRHTFASWLLQNGVPLDRVSKLLGHRSIVMTMRYAHLQPNKLHEDVAVLSSQFPETVSTLLASAAPGRIN